MSNADRQSRTGDNSRRWAVAGTGSSEEPVSAATSTINRHNSRLSPSSAAASETDMRGPNVSVLHIRGSSEPWETTAPSTLTSVSNAGRSYSTKRANNAGMPTLTKHHSLGANSGGASNQPYKWNNAFHSTDEVESSEIFVTNSCNRELSPVRWCDREVDGVYLGRSGWVQVQQRSLDDDRRTNYTAGGLSSSLQSGRRTAVKLANYHCNSEPGNSAEINRSTDSQRPTYLSLQTREFERKSATPSPRIIPESFSPPSITPIISPPPAFQDKNNKTSNKTRTFFSGKQPFLPRSKAIEDSDASPPLSPVKWKTSSTKTTQQQARKQKATSPSKEQIQRTYSRMPQTKSLEDTTAARRSQFLQRHGESSSSSSSSMGFRSLDSCMNRPAMPRLSENIDSSLDVYEDADDEDNNSSSLNVSTASTITAICPAELNRPPREKTSPSGRSNKPLQHRTSSRKSPAGSDSNKSHCASPTSSSTSSNDFPTRSPSGSTQQLRRSAPSRHYQHSRSPQEDLTSQRVRRSRSLQLPERKTSPKDMPLQTRVSPQHPTPHRVIIKMGNNSDRSKKQNISNKAQSLEDQLDPETLREAEVVTGFLYGSRSRSAAQALLMHRFHNNSFHEDKTKDFSKPTEKEVTVYIVGNSKKEKQKILVRGSATSSSVSSVKHTYTTSQEMKNPCNSDTCDFWPHCSHRQSLSLNREAQSMMKSQSYPMHQRSLDSTKQDSRMATMDRTNHDQQRKRLVHSHTESKVPANFARKKTQASIDPPADRENFGRSVDHCERRLSPNNQNIIPSPESVYERRASPINPRNTGKAPGTSNISTSSSSSDIWVTTSDRTISKSPKTAKSSGASTPLDDIPSKISDKSSHEIILTRPGSAPGEESSGSVLEAQQRSMSLPKSFLSATYQPSSGQLPWRKRGTDSIGSSPGCQRKVSNTLDATSHTAPVTPLHDGSRRRSPVGCVVRKAKASSTPQLLDATVSDYGKWNEKIEQVEEVILDPSGGKEFEPSRTLPVTGTESVLQKFRKTFSLRFQKKGSKDSSLDVGEGIADVSYSYEEESPQHVPSITSLSAQSDIKEEPLSEQKSKFGSLIWRSSKERKKLNKASRKAKCNSGDSGIQVEMVPNCEGAGDSSESHDTDAPADLDSPPAIRRRAPRGKSSRPHSDLINQILIDKFKSDLKQRTHKNQVRRTRSDLGGQRLLQWDPRSSYRRMMSSPAPLRGRPQSPRKKPPDTPGGVQLRMNHRRGQLRRSLSQPLDIDKLSPLMRAKTSGLRIGGPNVLSEDEHDTRCGTSEDEAMSDSESSLNSLSERKKSLELAMDEEMIILAEAVFDHVAIEAEELAFRAGDVIEVLETANKDWWWGSTNGTSGWFPSHFVRLRVSQEDTVEDCLAAMASGRSVSQQVRRRTSISLLSNDQVRTSVVRELVNTERDFVKVLTDVAEGYIYECRKRKDMFTEKQIETIFMNLEEILKFQSSFLKDLESCIDWDAPYKSCVGSCFLKYRSGFKMYSDYCNSHPVATATLQELYQFNNYSKFFEACRLMRGLIEIPLDGYLLTPVQRICKYPLQLAELLKYTKSDHPDYNEIKEALEAMRDVAILINERKRRMESLEKLAAWQQRVEGWEGEDLIEMSSQLIYQGEVMRVTTGMWTSNITLFLFDHQLVYCKKDILKRSTYIHKGRICLDTSKVVDVNDGKDNHLGVSVRHAIKLYSCVRDKWLLFCCRSSLDKQRWLEAFSEERKLVAQDKDDGLELPPAARHLARVAARCQKRPPRKPRSGKNYKRDSPYIGSALQLNTGSSNSLGRKVGTWFTFGAHKKSRHQHREVS